MNFIRLSHNGFTLEVDSDISTCNTASLHQAVKSIVYASPFVAHWFAAIGAFRSSLLFRYRIYRQLMRTYEGTPSNNWNNNED